MRGNFSPPLPVIVSTESSATSQDLTANVSWHIIISINFSIPSGYGDTLKLIRLYPGHPTVSSYLSQRGETNHGIHELHYRCAYFDAHLVARFSIQVEYLVVTFFRRCSFRRQWLLDNKPKRLHNDTIGVYQNTNGHLANPCGIIGEYPEDSVFVLLFSSCRYSLLGLLMVEALHKWAQLRRLNMNGFCVGVNPSF